MAAASSDRWWKLRTSAFGRNQRLQRSHGVTRVTVGEAPAFP
jgi:hypothetical protein